MSGRAAKNVFKNVSSSNKILRAEFAVEKIDALKKKEKLKKIQKDKAESIKKSKVDIKDKDNKNNKNESENSNAKMIEDEDIKNESDEDELKVYNETISNKKSDLKIKTKPEKLGRGARQREKKKLLKAKLENEEITEEEYSKSTKSKIDLKDLRQRREEQKIKHGGEKNDIHRLESIKNKANGKTDNDDYSDDSSDQSEDVIETDQYGNVM